MEVIVATLVVLLLVVVFVLLLILGLVRRVRVLGERVRLLESRSLGVDMVSDGDLIAKFDTVSMDGHRITAEWLDRAETVVAFVTYGCPACKVQLPVLRAFGERGGRVLVVAARVPGEEPAPAELRAALGTSPVLVEEEFGGSAQTAFSVDKYPTFFLVGADRALRASATGARDLLRFHEGALASPASA